MSRVPGLTFKLRPPHLQPQKQVALVVVFTLMTHNTLLCSLKIHNTRLSKQDNTEVSDGYPEQCSLSQLPQLL